MSMTAARATLSRFQHISQGLRPRYASTSVLTRQPRHEAIKPAPRFGNGRMDYSTLKPPALCYADFCLLPLGTGNPSVSKEIAAIQRLVKASGLQYSMHSAGTTVEGSWDEVFAVIGKAHALIHQSGAPRIQTDMRVGTRTDKHQPYQDKVTKVEELLAKEP